MRHMCPCCHSNLLRHVDREEIYWFCFHCKQKMPVIKQQGKR